MTATPADIDRLSALAYHRGIGTDVAPQALMPLIAAEIEAIEALVGPKANTEVVLPETRTDVISTLRRVAAITEVSERRLLTDPLAVTLADGADYRLLDDTKLLRIGSQSFWGEQAIIAYDAIVDQALRDNVVLNLLKLDLAFRTSARQQVGDLQVMDDYQERRAALLDQVSDGRILGL